MTTPRIQEMVAKYAAGIDQQNRRWVEYKDALLLAQEAHQAGIDEAVEELESKKQMVSQLFLDRGDQEMVFRSILNHRIDDIIKALQDNN